MKKKGKKMDYPYRYYTRESDGITRCRCDVCWPWVTKVDNGYMAVSADEYPHIPGCVYHPKNMDLSAVYEGPWRT